MKTHFKYFCVATLVALFTTSPMLRASGFGPMEFTLKFYQETAPSVYVENPNPYVGIRTLGSTIGTEWIVTPETKLHFTIHGDTAGGTLVFELYGRPEAVWDTSNNPPPPGQYASATDESFGKWELPITSTLLNSPVVQQVKFQQIADAAAILATNNRYREFYFGIYVKDVNIFGSTVNAFLNGADVGVQNVDYVFREGFQLPLLYAHPSWDVQPANLAFDTSNGMAAFTTLDTPMNNRPLHGALSSYRYRLEDIAPGDTIIAREWEFYQLNQNGVLLTSLTGEGAGGRICEFNVQNVEFILDTNNNWPVMLVLCRRTDDRGLTSIDQYTLANLGTDVFQYKVAYNPANYTPVELWVAQTTQAGMPGTSAIAMSDPNFRVLNPTWLYVQPHHLQLDNYQGGLEYRVRYSFANDGVVHGGGEEDWNHHDMSNQSGQNWYPEFTEINGSTSADLYPISVWWQFRTSYGTSNWTTEPASIRLFEQPTFPALNVDWSGLPQVLEAGSEFGIALQTTKPQSNPNAPFQGKFGLWVFNPDDSTQFAQIRNAGPDPCQFYNQWGDNASYAGYVIPDEVNNWNLGENSRLAIRLKFGWLRPGQSAVVDCNPLSSVQNPLNNFYYQSIGLILDPKPVFGHTSSQPSQVVLPEAGDFQLHFAAENPHVFDPSGDVNFAFLLERSGEASLESISWRWSKPGNRYWNNGAWATLPQGQTGAFHALWPSTTEVFANRWHWSPTAGLLEAGIRTGASSAFPFGTHNGQNLVSNFFGMDLEVPVTVEVRMTFAGQAEPVVRAVSFPVTPTVNDDLVLGLSMKMGGQSLSHAHARLSQLPQFEWEIPTLSNVVGNVRVALLRKDEVTAGTWQTLFCETMDPDLADPQSNVYYFSSFSTQHVSGQGLTYTLVANPDSGLHDLMTEEGAGEYQLRVSSQVCGGNWQQAFASRITVNPSMSFRLRFHYRDHLGSSAISRTYSPSFLDSLAGAEAYSLKVSEHQLTLYAKPSQAAVFDPYGTKLGNALTEDRSRYTDHEFDEASGFNYMKGRFSLAAYGGKFNRPDPMRDWDWENPSSINLYQYVRNNPAMNWDPNGFMRDFWGGFLSKTWENLEAIGDGAVALVSTRPDKTIQAIRQGLMEAGDTVFAYYHDAYMNEGILTRMNNEIIGMSEEDQGAFTSDVLMSTFAVLFPYAQSSLPAKTGMLGKAVEKTAKTLDDVPDAPVVLDQISDTSRLLAPPATVKHHIFNAFRGTSSKSQIYRDFFKKHGINVDDYTVKIPESMHKDFVHAAGRNWTTRWKRWIDENPNATTKEVYQFAGRLMDEYGLSDLPIVPYR